MVSLPDVNVIVFRATDDKLPITTNGRKGEGQTERRESGNGRMESFNIIPDVNYIAYHNYVS